MKRILPVIFAIVLILCFAAGGAFFLWLRSELETPYYGAPKPVTYIEIARGTNTGQIADLLLEHGLLHSRIPFILYVRYLDMGHRIQAGEYEFAYAATPKQIAQRLIQGDVSYRSVTVPEGLTVRETIELLSRNGFGSLEEMSALLSRTDWALEWDAEAQNLEGYLFPETYRFGRIASAEEVLKAMVDQFHANMQKIQQTQPLPPGWSIRQIVILASMIEKEVRYAEEGPLVASALVNRLKRRIPLSCDATIIYAMKLAGTYRGNLSKSDLKMDSPYNTYTRLNLPPGPICNPGANSIRAALDPAETDYLYYVSRNDGTHQFSKDLRSHNQAVDKYQKSLRRGNKSKN